MSSLVASVGEKGKNLHEDVVLVQSLLKSRGFDPGKIDGVCGTDTICAIRQFQGTFLAHPDGLIEPGRSTWQRLCGAEEGTPKPDWSGDSSKWPQEKKVKSMHPLLRSKVALVLEALGRRGFEPQVYYGWRSVKVQLQLYKAGHSRVKFSFHNAQKPDGTPNAYAADIIDRRFGWSDEAQSSGFWKALGQEAKKQGLIWGGDWPRFRDYAHVQLVGNDQLKRVKLQSGI